MSSRPSYIIYGWIYGWPGRDVERESRRRRSSVAARRRTVIFRQVSGKVRVLSAPLESGVKDKEDASATINASGSQGVQVGTGNFQCNAWTTKTPLDPASLSALNPHAFLGNRRLHRHPQRPRRKPADTARPRDQLNRTRNPLRNAT